MKTVKNLDEAMDFFLSNSSGGVKCVKDDSTDKVCNSYPEALSFFNTK